jgi:hypothetical protein
LAKVTYALETMITKVITLPPDIEKAAGVSEDLIEEQTEMIDLVSDCDHYNTVYQ